MSFKKLLGLEKDDAVTVVVVPEGQTPGSNPATTAAIRTLGPTVRRQDVSPQPGIPASND